MAEPIPLPGAENKGGTTLRDDTFLSESQEASRILYGQSTGPDQ